MKAQTQAFSRLSLLILLSLVPFCDVHAGPFEPEIDLFRLGAEDRLVINRGGPVANAGDINGDGLPDVIVGSGRGSVRVVFGPTNGDNGYLDTTIQRGIGGFAITGGASTVGGGGDINGDGLSDVVVGSDTATHVIFGRRESFPAAINTRQLTVDSGFSILTAGDAVSIIPDINGDGIDEVAIGSKYHDGPGYRDAGMISIVYGRSTPFPVVMHPYSMAGSQGFIAYGESTLHLLGWSIDSAGDFNSDGFADFIVGATGVNAATGQEAGRAYVLFGGPGFPSRLRLEDLNVNQGFVFSGDESEQVLGYSGQSAGDVNGDNIDDLIIGAPGKGPFGEPSQYPGEAYVVYGSQSIPARMTADSLNGLTGFVIRGIRGGTVPEQDGLIAWGDQAGFSVSGAGDINNDGRDDMIIGAPYTILSNARRGNGQVYVVYGRAISQAFPQELLLADLDGETGFRWNGIGTTDYTGFSVSQAGDFNNDGVDDVIVGASGQGESFVLYGREGAVFPR